MQTIFFPQRQVAAAVLPMALAATALWLTLGPLREPTEPSAQPQQPVAMNARAPQAQTEAAAEAEELLHRFALNALLAPLLDADAPPMRWADPALIPGCGAASAVRVDGEPLVVGATVPTGSFTLNWVMVDCMPFGNASISLSGTATLHVTPGETGTRAVVHAERMRIDGALVGAAIAQPFTAFLAHAPAGADAL